MTLRQELTATAGFSLCNTAGILCLHLYLPQFVPTDVGHVPCVPRDLSLMKTSMVSGDWKDNHFRNLFLIWASEDMEEQPSSCLYPSESFPALHGHTGCRCLAILYGTSMHLPWHWCCDCGFHTSSVPVQNSVLAVLNSDHHT